MRRTNREDKRHDTSLRLRDAGRCCGLKAYCGPEVFNKCCGGGELR